MRMSAAERRVRACAPGASTLREAVLHVVAELMHGVRCPPTDLTEFGQKIGVLEITYESFPGSGELHTINNGYRIICSSDQSRPRQRFTVAHELAHVILERTGRNAPRKGNSVERVCDMLAAECLAISEFPKWRKYLISLSFRGQSSVRPVQVGGFDVNIVIHRSTAVRGRGGPARHDAWPPSLGAILAHTDGPCGS